MHPYQTKIQSANTQRPPQEQ